MEILAFTAEFQVIGRQFGEIADAIEQRWGSQRLVPYLRDLIGQAQDVSNVRPSKFPANVVAAMEALCAKHETECPAPAPDESVPVIEPTPPFNLLSSPELALVNRRFQRLGAKIEASWGTAALSPFINQLLYDTREGARQGFPPEVAKAIFVLMVRHDELFPDMAVIANDIWTPKPPPS